MRKIMISALAALCFLGCAGGPRGSQSGSTLPPEPGVLETREIYGLLKWGTMAFHNDCWGYQALAQPAAASSEIRWDTASSSFGWRWSCPQEKEMDLKGYPHLIVGDKPYTPAGFDPSTDPRFPLPLRTMESLWVEGEMSVSAEGRYDFAYDLPFLEGPLSSPGTVRAEIMVWLASSFTNPTNRGEYKVDGRTYGLFVNTTWNPGIPYMSFVLKEGDIPRRIPLHEFIRIGRDVGYINPDYYLAVVELGPEIWWGTGSASVKGFSVSLNGD